MTTEIFASCFPKARASDIAKFTMPLNITMDMYSIDTPKRQAAFLAQLAHESGSLRYVREIATGEAYEGRHDLGNTQPGDGVKFKGRGLIQITGRANYRLLSQALSFDFISFPERLEWPGPAAMSSGWFWGLHNLNELADHDDFTRITKIINGGFNGYEDRLHHWERIKKVLNVI